MRCLKVTKSLLSLLVLAVICIESAGADIRDLRYGELLFGTGGPTQPKVEYFASKRAAEASWLASTLSPTQLQEILAKLDFANEVLLVIAIGERRAATGNVKITRVRQIGGGKWPTLDVSVLVGTAGARCIQAPQTTNPFLLVSVKGFEANEGGAVGFDIGNFPDKCPKGK